MTGAPREFDVAIIGGGLAGASLAAALAAGEIKTALIEAASDEERARPEFDARSIALTDDARRIYTQLGVWKQVAGEAQPIREIHISDRGHFGMARLRAEDAGTETDALGHVLPARVLGAALHCHVRAAAHAEVFCPARVREVKEREQHWELHVSAPGGGMALRAPLVVLADGGRSGLAAQLGIAEAEPKAYSQLAVLCQVSVDLDHHGRAYERFTREGPLALLPSAARRYAVVWTGDEDDAKRRAALSDEDFTAELQTAFGDRAGAFGEPSARRAYPLRRGRAHPLGRRAVSIGDAAHVVHPVAGQGFNLGLRDAAALAETLRAAARDGRDFGGRAALESYAAARRRETARVSGFTDGLMRVFCSRSRPLGFARSLALAGIELCPPAKRMLLWRTMGMAAARARE
ncbi:MAG: 2-octaprenyl-6-methoxyphenyl hydroxylase [Gammaproteobacteria bacterium]|nr:2-octaprenyl-6-methoxyphenyl hydroxylase [Gammaproteobacteria bacterium]